MEAKALATDKKKALNEGYTLVFADESAFYQLPGVRSTWARRGEPPVLRAPLRRDHLSVISAISSHGTLSTQIQRKAFKGATCLKFLKHLVRTIGRVLVIWDGAPIHRSKLIKEYLANEGADMVHLEQFPPYAPEVNPDEGIWQYLKHVELANVCCQTIDDLKYELRCAIARLRHKRDIILGCIKQTGLV
jgi:transposase